MCGAIRCRYGRVGSAFETEYGTLRMFVHRNGVVLGNLVIFTAYFEGGEVKVKIMITL